MQNRTKTIILFIILLLPVVLVLFLYQFGKNNYKVKSEAYSASEFTDSFLARMPRDSSTIIALIPSAPGPDLCLFYDRVLYRLAKLKEYGPIRVVMVSDSTAALCKQLDVYRPMLSGLAHRPGDIYNHLAIKDSVTDSGKFVVLANREHQIVSAYDLGQEKFIDSLVTEALITIQN